MSKTAKSKAKKPRGGQTKYNEKIAKELVLGLTNSTIRDTCKQIGIEERTYYNWMLEHEDLFQLSLKARGIKAINHFAACEDILEEIKHKKDDPDYRADLARTRLDFHLRLAGKANQALFGEQAKNIAVVNQEFKDVDVPQRMTQEEWEAKEV